MVVTLPRSTPSVRQSPSPSYVVPLLVSIAIARYISYCDKALLQLDAGWIKLTVHPRNRSPTTRSTLMSTPRTSSSRPSSNTTAHSSSPTTGGASPRSSEVQVPAPGTRSLTDRRWSCQPPLAVVYLFVKFVGMAGRKKDVRKE